MMICTISSTNSLHSPKVEVLDDWPKKRRPHSQQNGITRWRSPHISWEGLFKIPWSPSSWLGGETVNPAPVFELTIVAWIYDLMSTFAVYRVCIVSFIFTFHRDINMDRVHIHNQGP